MNYEDLRRAQRMERNNLSSLAPLDKNFYEDMAALIAEYKVKRASSSDDQKVYENIIKITLDVCERREQKILLKALRAVKTGESADASMTAQEKKFFYDSLAMLKENRLVFEGILTGKPQKTAAMAMQNIRDIPSISNGENKPAPAEDLNSVLVRIIKKVPKFISEEMKDIGPFEENEIIKLPRKDAELLSKGNLAEII